MSTLKPVLVRVAQGIDSWPLDLNRAIRIGSQAADPDEAAPDINLYPDETVSRTHALMWFDKGDWWIEDLNSDSGTVVRGEKIKGPTRLKQWDEIQFGSTVLMLVPPYYRCLKWRDLMLEIETHPTINLSLAHSKWPIVSQLFVRNIGGQKSRPADLEIELPEYVSASVVKIPALSPGERIGLPRPAFRFEYKAFENQIERNICSISVRLDGIRPQGEVIECWLLAHNEWSCLPELQHRVSLASFVQPNHPLVAQATAEACEGLGADTEPLKILSAVYNYFYDDWRLRYQLEPPSYESFSQKIRLVHQVLLDFASRRGEGTCIDLVLLLAACLERRGVQPLIAIVEAGEWQHALVGCRVAETASAQPVITDHAPALEGAVWVDATGVTVDPTCRMEFGRAVERATGFINQRQFLFALHIGSARQQVQPLPFAGEPKLSAQARMAIEQAWAYARERPTQLSTVVLLMGLLSVKAVAREVIESNVGNVDKVIDRLWSGLPEMPVVEGRHFESVKSLAHALAKNEGSPLVLDYHLLDALLEIQSDALDKALRLIATTRRDLRAYLYKSIRSDRAQKSITSIFSQFPSE